MNFNGYPSFLICSTVFIFFLHFFFVLCCVGGWGLMRSIPKKRVCGLDCAEIADSVSRDLYVAVMVTGDDRFAKLLLDEQRVDVMP